MLGHTCHNLPRRRRRCVPDVERRPASVQIADHYRDRILAGELSPGDRLPSAADLAAQWHVAKQTVTRAVGRLQVEGAVYTTPRGTFVASDDRIIRSPRPIRHGKGERVKLDEVGIVLAPNYVAELLDLEPGAMVIRRRVTHAQDHIEGREADAREAHALKIPVGSAILAGAHVWSDQEGVILYGEWVMPPKRVVSYSYEVAE